MTTATPTKTHTSSSGALQSLDQIYEAFLNDISVFEAHPLLKSMALEAFNMGYRFLQKSIGESTSVSTVPTSTTPTT